MEHSLQRKTEVNLTPTPAERLAHPEIWGSKDTSAGRFVDEKISDVIRMTVATSRIVLESIGCPDKYGVEMQERVLRMLGVKERRMNG